MAIISNFPGGGKPKGNALPQDVLKSKTFSGGIGNEVVGTLMVSEGAVFPDTLNKWTSRTSAADIIWTSVTYGNGLFVAVAAYSGTYDRVMTSPDGITWTSRTSAADDDWRSVTYGNGLFVAVAYYSVTGNGVMTSHTGFELLE